jgi:hypothetical protein
LPNNYFELLENNKKAFIEATTEEELITGYRRGRDSGAKILKILKATIKNSKKLTDDQEDYLRKLIIRLEEGAIPKQTTKKALKALNDLKSDLVNPLKVLAVLQHNIPQKLLESHYVEFSQRFSGRREVILSLYLKGENNE